MINCAHPTHFEAVLDGEPWRERIRGLRANASTRSHAELDEATELDEGDPADLAARYAGLTDALPRLNVLGGCCGTDHRHVAAIAGAWRRAALARSRSVQRRTTARRPPEARVVAAGGRSREWPRRRPIGLPARRPSGRHSRARRLGGRRASARRCQLSSRTKMTPPTMAARMIDAATVMVAV